MIYADHESHRIEGYARAALERGLDGNFSCPLISHVKGNLWQGGCISGVALPEDFRYVISLYPWERYKLGPKTTRVEIEMYDMGELPDLEQLDQIADNVVELSALDKTLVHCQAGLNRSGLVAGLALVKGGMSGREAIDLMRAQRSQMVLCNEAFETWLLGHA